MATAAQALAAVALCGVLGACGQKGALVLPKGVLPPAVAPTVPPTANLIVPAASPASVPVTR